MNRTLTILLSIALPAATACAQGAQQAAEEGYTLRKSIVQGFGGGERQSSTLYMTPTRVRETSSNGSDFLLFLDRSVFVTLDHEARTYTELTFSELASQIEGLRTSIQQSPRGGALEGMRRTIGGASKAATVEDLGNGPELLGYSTRHSKVTLGSIEMELWTAPELPLPAAYYDSLQLRALANPLLDLDKLYEGVKQVEGLSLKTVLTIEAMDMNIQSTSEVTEIVPGPIPDLVFEVPEGYARKDPPAPAGTAP